jgi:hypothetical protein
MSFSPGNTVSVKNYNNDWVLWLLGSFPSLSSIFGVLHIIGTGRVVLEFSGIIFIIRCPLAELLLRVFGNLTSVS